MDATLSRDRGDRQAALVCEEARRPRSHRRPLVGLRVPADNRKRPERVDRGITRERHGCRQADRGVADRGLGAPSATGFRGGQGRMGGLRGDADQPQWPDQHLPSHHGLHPRGRLVEDHPKPFLGSRSQLGDGRSRIDQNVVGTARLDRRSERALPVGRSYVGHDDLAVHRHRRFHPPES